MDIVNIRPFRVAAGNVEIVPLGVDIPDYFQGFGVAHTDFQHSAIGIGDTEAEAYNDACEQVAQACTSEQFKALALPEAWGDESRSPADAFLEEEAEEAEACGAQFYVGIRYNVIE